MSKVRLLARAHAHAVSSLVAACVLACALNFPAHARQQQPQPNAEQQELKPFGPLAYRQGKPMRPDVAEAFDRMAADAQAHGVTLVINSAFRSDAAQADLWAANPDPRWVAPPGQSLHRCATELDLGPPSAYSWLASHAGRFDFLQRYSWEEWHYGFTGGPPPCSSAGDAVGMPGSGVLP